MIREFWKGLGAGARTGLVAAVVALVVGTAVVAWLLVRADYQVLFADLAPQDAASMTAELERQKVPFRLGAEGADGSVSILVDRKDVYRTRLKVMAKDLPLRGTVGFELFNNSDFGMTEFAQRINFQRALQGELTRTILALAEVRDVRVLLAMPEQGLFKQNRSKATASVTLTMRQGRGLAPAQVAGIQRLVSAAVPGIAIQDVTIVDQTGVALTRNAGEPDGDGGSARLDLKKDTEHYLARKADEVLARTLGAGEAIASVDVTLDMDRVQTTTEDVVAAPGHPQSGVVVRERETIREVNPPMGTQSSGDAAGTGAAGSSQREVEYAVGRRVEQVIGQPGSIRRIQVAVVVRKELDERRRDELKALVAASVGAVADRGDAVVIQGMPPAEVVAAASAAAEPDAGAWPSNATPAVALESASPAVSTPKARALGPLEPRVAASVLGVLALAALAFVLLRSRQRPAPKGVVRLLSEVERRAALNQVQSWMRGEAPRAAGDGR